MSNKSQPHRKFVQTFVLASQTNGYFVLNDIFRYIKDDEDEEEAAAGAEVEEEKPVATEIVHVEAQGTEEEVKEEILRQVEKKLEDVKVEAEAETVPATNGTPVPESADIPELEEVASVPENKPEEVEAAIVEEDTREPEKPQDPVPTPKTEEPAQPVASTPAAPPKPAVPKSWAQLAAGNQAKAAAAAAAPAARQAPSPAAPSQPKAAPAPAAPAAAPSAPAAREASPDSAKEGSTGGWQTAGADHARKQSRAQNAPTQSHDGRVRAFVKNVTEDVDADALKQVLSRHGDIVYFDVARQKVRHNPITAPDLSTRICYLR